MSEQPPARVETDGPLATIVIGLPPLNLFGGEMVRSVEQALATVEESDARALMLRAEGSVFTGGADVNGFKGLSAQQAADFFGAGLGIIHRLEALPMPTLSCVHGLCLTAGFELSLACDMIWASASASFGLVEAVVGLTPAWGGTQRLVERAGAARASELVMSGRIYDAATLERWNVVNRVLPDDELLEKATRFAQQLAGGPTVAHAATKQIVRAARSGGVAAADAITASVVGPLFETDDLNRAVESFLIAGPGKGTFEGR